MPIRGPDCLPFDRKDRDDLVSNAVRMLVDDVHQPDIFELVILIDGSYPSVGLVLRFPSGRWSRKRCSHRAD
jgi:hypothetical protein